VYDVPIYPIPLFEDFDRILHKKVLHFEQGFGIPDTLLYQPKVVFLAAMVKQPQEEQLQGGVLYPDYMLLGQKPEVLVI